MTGMAILSAALMKTEWLSILTVILLALPKI